MMVPLPKVPIILFLLGVSYKFNEIHIVHGRSMVLATDKRRS